MVKFLYFFAVSDGIGINPAQTAGTWCVCVWGGGIGALSYMEYATVLWSYIRTTQALLTALCIVSVHCVCVCVLVYVHMCISTSVCMQATSSSNMAQNCD